jgi:predicted phosphate transport protein (TIGR00153 family)
MKRSFRQVLRDLMGHSSEAVVTRVDAQLDVVVDAIALVRRACDDDLDVAEEIGTLEREGDDRRVQLTRSLSSALITPIDREDLFRLSRSIDDVLDNVRDFGRELGLYHPPARADFLPMLDEIGEAVAALRDAVATLGERPATIVDAARDASHAASHVRRHYELAVGGLLDQPVDAGWLGQRELFRRLDVVGLRLGEAASALADGGLKRVE